MEERVKGNERNGEVREGKTKRRDTERRGRGKKEINGKHEGDEKKKTRRGVKDRN